MLGDRARFLVGDVGVADRILQRSLAVVDVAHESDHRGAFLQKSGIVFRFRFRRDGGRRRFGRLPDDQLDSVVFAELFRIRLADRLIDAGEFAELDQVGDQFIGLFADRFGQHFHNDRGGQRQLAVDHRRTCRGCRRGFLRLGTVFAAAGRFFLFAGGRFLGAFPGGLLIDGSFRFLLEQVGEVRLDQFDHVVRNHAVFGLRGFDSLAGEFFDDLFRGYAVLLGDLFNFQYLAHNNSPARS